MGHDSVAAAGKGRLAGQDARFALEALRRMAFIRAFEQACLDLSARQPPVVAGSIHLCAGQEAIPVGAMAALRPGDQVTATYRGHGWALESGLDPLAVMAEICHRATGVNGGRAGSALMMAPDKGFIGENSIVGAGVPIAAGVAMAEKLRGSGAVAIVSIGDGALNQGATHEGLVFAMARLLPMVLVCENNRWSEMTPTSRIVPFERLSRRATGYGMQGVTIDGTDPIAVRDTIALAAEHARAGKGPSFIECQTIRLWGHYNRDIEHYRPREDREDHARRDPLALLRERVEAAGIAGPKAIDALLLEVQAEIDDLVAAASAAPLPDPATAGLHVVAAPAVAPKRKAKPGQATTLTYAEAVNRALARELAERPEVLVYGEDVGHAGGIFGCTRGLQKEFGEDRVFDTPIAEASILGSAVGAAMRGLRPVVEIMWFDFMLVALDQVINQAANVRYVSGGTCAAPLVIRTQQGATPGSCAQHSQSLEALLFHIPGLRIGVPSTPQDAYAMLRAAVADPDPCLIIEARALYQTKGEVALDAPVAPIGGLARRRDGKDVALIGWGTVMGALEAAAETLAKDGIQAAVIDLRWLNPLAEDDLIAAVRDAGGRAVIAHEANLTGGVGAEIAWRLAHAGIHAVARVGSPDARMPASPVLQKALLPNAEHIAKTARHLAGRTAT